MQAGIQPPLGVTETTQPCLSAAWMEVVPAVKFCSNASISASLILSGSFFQEVEIGIFLPFKRIGIARLDIRVIQVPIDLFEPFPGIFFGQ